MTFRHILRGSSTAPFRLPQSLRTRRNFTMSTTSYSSHSDNLNSNSDSSTSSTTKATPLALPEVPHNAPTKLDLSSGGTTIKLDHLGPMVVNVDGSLGRITNWEGMTEMEKQSTLRIVGKRNQSRLAALKAKEAEKTGEK